MLGITKISTKGQVVIPQRIREDLELGEGSRLVIERVDDLIIMKKVSIDSLKEEFKRLTKKGERFAQEHGIKNEDDVIKIIHQRRKKM